MKNKHPKLNAIARVGATALFCAYTMFPGLAFAESGSTGSGTTKEETVYVFSKADGSVKNITVSDWLQNGDKYTFMNDVSNLSDIQNTEGRETYTTGADGAMTWDSSGNDIYYQGASTDTPPVDMKVTYLLDGKEVTPDSLAGKSGNVTIRYEFTNNSQTDGVNTPFLVLTGAIMNNDTFSNISINHGRTVNDGDRTYVVGYALPGMQANLGVGDDVVEIPEGFEITAYAQDFKLETTATIMTSDMFSGVDADTLDEMDINDSMQLLESSMLQIIDGASSLDSGLHELASGTDTLAAGADVLATGTGELSDGADQLSSGAGQLASGTSQLVTGSSQLAAGTGALKESTKDMPNQTATLAVGANQVSSGISALRAGVNGAKQSLDTLAATDDLATQLTNVSTALATGGDALEGAATLAGASAAEAGDAASSAQSAATSAGSAVSSMNEASADNEATISAIGDISVEVTGKDAAKTAVKNALTNAGVTDEDTINEVLATVDEVDATVTGKDTATAKAEVTQDQIDTAKSSVSTSAGNLESDAETLSTNATTLQSYATTLQTVGEQLASVEIDATSLEQLAYAQAYVNAIYNNWSSLESGSSAVASGTQQLADSAPTLVAGVNQLDSGAQSLSSGAQQVDSGAQSLSSGSQEVASGAQQVDSGAQELASGSHALASGAQTAAAGCDTLTSGLNQFNEQGIQKLVDALGGVGNLTGSLKSIVDAGNDYHNFSGIHPETTGTVKFVYETDAIGEN
jgi:putative membrane protein